MNPVPDMDGRLYGAILHSQGHWANNLYDLKKVKVLDDFTWSVDPYYERPWGKLASGDFSAIGLMENLHTLVFFSRLEAEDSVLEVNDFSFLTRCKKLKKLDLRNTNFTDCALLAELPALKRVKLPAKKHLSHMEILDSLPCSAETDDFVFDLPDYELIPAQSAPFYVLWRPPAPTGAFAIRSLEYDGYDGTDFQDGEITQDVVDEMLLRIRSGASSVVCLSTDAYAEESFFTIDIDRGWAVPAYNTWNEDGEARMYLPVNEKYDLDEAAPVCIGGQTPVPKRFALDDLNLAAECALHFAKTGKLYPGVPWAKFD